MNEREQLLNAVAEAIEQAMSHDCSVKEIVKAITSGVVNGTTDRSDANYILKDMSYLIQPWINPYYFEDQKL